MKMFTSTLGCLLFLCLIFHNEGADQVEQVINWNGNDWAKGCDFNGRNHSNAQTTADGCGPKCFETSGCTHFTWTSLNGGTCWMKQGIVSKHDAISTIDSTTICGLLPRPSARSYLNNCKFCGGKRR